MTRSLLASHPALQEGDNRVQETGDIVGKPPVQMSGIWRRHIKGELEWSHLKENIQDL